MADLLPPLRPIPIKERLSVLYIERGQLDVLDGAFVVVDVTGVRTHIPVGGVACLMPGARRAHRPLMPSAAACCWYDACRPVGGGLSLLESKDCPGGKKWKRH
jgi:hypothetical protein